MKATYVRVSSFEPNISRQIEGKEGGDWDKVSGMVAFEDGKMQPGYWLMLRREK